MTGVGKRKGREKRASGRGILLQDLIGELTPLKKLFKKCGTIQTLM